MDYGRFSDLLRSTTLATLVVMMSFSAFLAIDDSRPDREELEHREMPLYATSPGHPVFGEYVGAHWCGPCMNSASPSLDNLKTSNSEDFTFVSIFESSSGGWPSDSINRRGHVMSSSGGYPTFSFADTQSGTCYKVGAGGTNYYDADYTAGGCMSSDVADYSLDLSVALDSATNQVTVTVESTYLGSSSSVIAYLYAAVTEKVGGDAYDNGVRPHHNFRDWLLNGNGDGFEQLSLTPNTPVETSWTVPLSTVRAAGGYTQFENFWPVIALMDGPHSSYNNVLTATDLDMLPLIDIGISDISADNQNGALGFVPGDLLDITVEVTNNGVDSYSDGGEISIYELVGLDENYIGGSSIHQSIQPGSTQSLTIQFDTSHIDTYASGTTTFRARLSGLSGDRVASNNYADINALHDMAPVANQPTAVASVSIDRGDTIQFESSALSNDLVDDMTTMTPTMHYALSGTDFWDDAWIISSDLVGSGGNARYLHTIDAPLNADVGAYDLRIRWTDSGGQQGDWLLSEEAFILRNGLPVVLNGDYSQYAGMPTVKVETEERVSLINRIHDAETPLSMLTIDSNSPEFIEWDSSTLELVVNFDEVVRDSEGNPIPQGIFITIDDGDDTNSGMMMFNVIENGAPRWAPIPSQSFNEGGSASISLTSFLSDTDDSGNPIPSSGLTLELISISDESLVEASISGHSLSVNSLDDDSTGMVELNVRASDGSKTSDTTIVFHVLNVNDAPRLDMNGIDEFSVEMGERITLELSDRMTDIDDPDEEIWPSVSTFVPGAAQLNQITGILTMEWSEAGTETVTIMLEDRHGATNAYAITVTVIDNLPLLWDDDLVASFDTTEYGTNPTVVVENVGPLELNDIRVIWSVCNSITGICHSSGVSHNLGPFIVNPSSGNGLGIGDYVTLSVSAEDQDGFDRLTEIQLKIFATEPSEVETLPEEDQDSNPSSDPGKWISTGLLVIGILLSAALVLALAITLRRQRFESNAAIDYTSIADEGPTSYPEPSSPPDQIPPPPPMVPPLPPEGLPPGWTMEQWHYYGEEYLRRRQ